MQRGERQRNMRDRAAAREKRELAEAEYPIPTAPLGSIAELKLLVRAAVAEIPNALEALTVFNHAFPEAPPTRALLVDVVARRLNGTPSARRSRRTAQELADELNAREDAADRIRAQHEAWQGRATTAGYFDCEHGHETCAIDRTRACFDEALSAAEAAGS